ncbi:MAG: AraC family transcriptional regulator [Thiomicrorhabdus sp.]|nr:AraC family transcriptional regulator [Thiomicrorhabdus sp.]
MIDSNKGTSPAACLILIDYLYSIGHDGEQYLIDAGLDVAWIHHAETWLPFPLLEDTWRVVLNIINDELLGFHAGLAANGLKSNILAVLASNCMNVEQALDKVCEYHGVMSSGPLPRLDKGKDTSTFTVETTGLSQRVSQHITETMFAIIIMLLRQMTRKKISPVRVQLSRPQPAHSNDLETHFQCPIEFNYPVNGMLFSNESLPLPVPHADPQFLITIERHAEYLLGQQTHADSWEGKVKQALIKSVNQGNMNIRNIAGQLFVSTRTLQKKLNKEDINFQQILDATRKEIAIDYLKDENISLIDLALHLGFSEQSAFNHAFKRWVGCTPTEYKKMKPCDERLLIKR